MYCKPVSSKYIPSLGPLIAQRSVYTPSMESPHSAYRDLDQEADQPEYEYGLEIVEEEDSDDCDTKHSPANSESLASTPKHRREWNTQLGMGTLSAAHPIDEDRLDVSDEIMRNALFLLALKNPSLKKASLQVEAGSPYLEKKSKKHTATSEMEWKGREDICVDEEVEVSSDDVPALSGSNDESETSSSYDEDANDEMEQPSDTGTGLSLPGKRKRPVERKRATADQVVVLEKMYREDKFPSSELIKQTGQLLGMKPSKVKNWFQNKRAKERRVAAGKDRRSSSKAKAQLCSATTNANKKRRLEQQQSHTGGFTHKGTEPTMVTEDHELESVSGSPSEATCSTPSEEPLPFKKRCLAVPLNDRRAFGSPLGQDGHPRYFLPPLTVDPSPIRPLRLFSTPLPPTLSAAPHQCQRQ